MFGSSLSLMHDIKSLRTRKTKIQPFLRITELNYKWHTIWPQPNPKQTLKKVLGLSHYKSEAQPSDMQFKKTAVIGWGRIQLSLLLETTNIYLTKLKSYFMKTRKFLTNGHKSLLLFQSLYFVSEIS